MAFDLTGRAFESLRKPTFEDWCEKVDALFVKHIGLGRDDWPDQDYWELWSECATPMEALHSAVSKEYGLWALVELGLVSPPNV